MRTRATARRYSTCVYAKAALDASFTYGLSLPATILSVHRASSPVSKSRCFTRAEVTLTITVILDDPYRIRRCLGYAFELL
jgi:hypothetical protein